MNYKLPKEIKNKMLREIKQYEHNKKKLHRLQERSQDTTTRQYIYLEERLYYVETVYMRLKDSERKIYNYIFKEGCNWQYCQSFYNIDKHTYYDVYNKSLYFLAEEFGEI